ncbi:MAG: amidohydrolase [Clostridia bacterium]|nr:amidohydrolase [Clostridia bacterium]
MDNVERRIIELIDQNREKIIAFGRDIHEHAEMGYKETRTSDKFVEAMAEVGLDSERGLAITGAKSNMEAGREQIKVALLGEYDALMIPQNPWCNKETGAAHCCGHDAQLTGVVGAAIALTDPEVRQALDGDVCFFGVPSEEYGEIAFKDDLVKEGKIRFAGGKSELLRIGAFDDIDLCIAHHTGIGPVGISSVTNSGMVSKVVRYKGRASHAAGSPDKGVNALNAASLGMSAMSMIRETFRDEDHIRVHAIMTKGGDLVNVIPNQVQLEALVRGLTMKGVEETSPKFDRAFAGGAIAMGAGVTISTRPGYLPVIPLRGEDNRALIDAAAAALPEGVEPFINGAGHSGGSTDVGDLQHVMPVLQFTTGGFRGVTHGIDFEVVDEDEYYVLTAKMFALTTYHLLKDGAKEAKRLKENYKPVYTKQEYIDYMESWIRDEELAQLI